MYKEHTVWQGEVGIFKTRIQRVEVGECIVYVYVNDKWEPSDDRTALRAYEHAFLEALTYVDDAT